MTSGESTATTGRLDRHVPRITLDWMVDEPERQWRLVEGSMVFADISGFTALSERLATLGRIGTEELVEILSRVFGGMLDVAASHGGQLLKFGGDALLLLFTGEDHARHAASAAIEMRRELRRAAEIPTSVGRVKLSVSIGAHTGAFHLFLVGDHPRLLVVLGPDTTTTLQCEAAAEAGQIVVSPELAAQLGPKAVAPRDDGRLVLRPRSALVQPCGAPPRRASDAETARLLIPAIIADALERVPDPVHRIATVGFFKFSGIDNLLAAEGPDAVAAQLDATLRIATEAFAAEDVALLYVDVDEGGGKLFCLSGVPLTSEDDEGRMLRSARAILGAHPPLGLRVGINRGHVFAAELGAEQQAAFSAMGDTVNTAARIMVTADKGVIHVHPSVLEHARTRYETTAAGPFTFKGKAQPQVVYAVGEEIGPREVLDRDELPLVGREEELAELIGHLDAHRSGSGGVVTLVGGVGLGKSRLLREALHAGDDVPVLEVHAEPYGANSPYRVVRDPLRALLGVGRGTPEEMAAALRASIRREAPDLEPYLPLLGDVLQIPVDDTAEVALIEPRFRPDRTADVVVDVMGRLRPGPLVIAAEDMHWADSASAHLLGRIATATATRPWSLVTVRRDVGGGFVTELGVTIEVAPLSADEIRSLAAAATDATPLRPHEIDLVVARASGSPLFVGELLAAAQELGSLDAVPASLQGTMAAQVDALDPLSKRALSYASILGRSFRRSVVTELLRRVGLRLDSPTVAKLSRFLDADGPHRFKFRNGLVCDVVYDGLAYRAKSRLHLEAGEALEQISGNVSADSDVLSLHFWRAGDHERTYRYAVMAGENAATANANADAAMHYERAADAARRLDSVPDDERRALWVKLGDVREQAGMLDAALEAYQRAAALARGDVLAQAEIHFRRAVVRERAGAFRQALSESSRGRRIVAELDDPEAERMTAQSLAFAAMVRDSQQRPREARRAAQAAAAAAARCGDDRTLALAHNVLMLTGLVLGGDDTARHAQRALELYEQLGDLSGMADMANNLGVLAYYEGRWGDTVEQYRRAVEGRRRVGNFVGAAAGEANIGEVLVNQGRFDEAEPLLRDAVRVLRSSGYVPEAAFSETQLGRVLVASGDLAAAERLLRALIQELEEIGRSASVYEASIHLADCLISAGRADEALATVSQTIGTRSEEVAIFDASVAVVHAGALWNLGRRDEALEVIVQGVSRAREMELEYDLARLLLLADRSGPPTDPRLGTDEPAEEAKRLFGRLGVVDILSA